MVTRLISESDAVRIEAAVAQAEAKAATELVVAVVSRSDDYWRPRVLTSLSWAFAAALALHQFRPDVGVVLLLAVQLVVGLLVYAATSLSALGRPLISRQQAAHAVRRRAFALFAERGIHQTHAHTGLLILLSEYERQVVVLGDSGLKQLIGDAGFKAYADEVIRNVRAGRAADGILEVIRRIENVVAAVSPRGAGNENELPNAVIREN